MDRHIFTSAFFLNLSVCELFGVPKLIKLFEKGGKYIDFII